MSLGIQPYIGLRLGLYRTDIAVAPIERQCVEAGYVSTCRKRGAMTKRVLHPETQKEAARRVVSGVNGTRWDIHVPSIDNR